MKKTVLILATLFLSSSLNAEISIQRIDHKKVDQYKKLIQHDVLVNKVATGLVYTTVIAGAAGIGYCVYTGTNPIKFLTGDNPDKKILKELVKLYKEGKIAQLEVIELEKPQLSLFKRMLESSISMTKGFADNVGNTLKTALPSLLAYSVAQASSSKVKSALTKRDINWIYSNKTNIANRIQGLRYLAVNLDPKSEIFDKFKELKVTIPVELEESGNTYFGQISASMPIFDELLRLKLQAEVRLANGRLESDELDFFIDKAAALTSLLVDDVNKLIAFIEFKSEELAGTEFATKAKDLSKLLKGIANNFAVSMEIALQKAEDEDEKCSLLSKVIEFEAFMPAVIAEFMLLEKDSQELNRQTKVAA